MALRTPVVPEPALMAFGGRPTLKGRYFRLYRRLFFVLFKKKQFCACYRETIVLQFLF
jgi:hypothetical protein